MKLITKSSESYLLQPEDYLLRQIETLPICDECEASVKVLVQVGEEEYYETRTADICLSCLQKAIKLIQGENSD